MYTLYWLLLCVFQSESAIVKERELSLELARIRDEVGKWARHGTIGSRESSESLSHTLSYTPSIKWYPPSRDERWEFTSTCPKISALPIIFRISLDTMNLEILSWNTRVLINLRQEFGFNKANWNFVWCSSFQCCTLGATAAGEAGTGASF